MLGVLTACVRRWWVFVPVIALTAWLCAQQYQDAQPQFTSNAVVVVAPSDSLVYVRGSQSDTGLVVTSPFNGANGDRVLAGLLARALNTAGVREKVLPSGGALLQATRILEEDNNVVILSVVANSQKTADASVKAAVTEANGVLASIQRSAGVKDGQYFDAVDGGPIDPPLVSYPDRVRGVVGFGLAGLLLAVVLAVVADGLLMVRRRRRSSPRASRKRSRAQTGSKRHPSDTDGTGMIDLEERLDAPPVRDRQPHRVT